MLLLCSFNKSCLEVPKSNIAFSKVQQCLFPIHKLQKFYFYGHINRRELEKDTYKEKFYVAGPILLTLSNP